MKVWQQFENLWFWVLETTTAELQRTTSWGWQDDRLCCNKMVQISGATTRLHWLWARSWYVGDRLYHGRAIRRLAPISRRLRNGPALLDLKSSRQPNQGTNGVIQQESALCRAKIPRNLQAWNPWEAIHDLIVEESALTDDWASRARPCQ